MSPETIGIIGVCILMVLLFARMSVGLAMAFIGFWGFAAIVDFSSAVGVLTTEPYRQVANYNLSVVPLFIFMGLIASNTGMCEDLYKTAYAWFGQFPGGVAMATMSACAGFAAICGDSMAQAATMGNVAVPEMKKYRYDLSLATGCVAAGGTLGILIPPSLGFILYSILTEESVGLLFMAGILPGLLLTGLFILIIGIMCIRNPKLGPRGPKTGFFKKIASLKHTGAMLALFIIVMGGIYAGIFTPTEAGAIGAFGAIVISAVRGTLTGESFFRSIIEAGRITAMIFMILIGAFIFMRFLAISNLPSALAEYISNLNQSRFMTLTMILFVYLILGMFMDIIAALILTIPIFYPSLMAMGFDSVWFGVIMVLVLEMGLITPPVGMNAFVIAGVTKTPLGTVFRGSLPFVLSIICCVVLVTLFPQIALYIPSLLK